MEGREVRPGAGNMENHSGETKHRKGVKSMDASKSGGHFSMSISSYGRSSVDLSRNMLSPTGDQSSETSPALLPSPLFSPTMMSPRSPTFEGNKELLAVQERTFRKWLNVRLETADLPPMTDLATDMTDGVRLIQLLEIFSDTSLGRYTIKPRLRVQKAENIDLALQFIRRQGVNLTNIGPEDIMDGNLKLILGLVWTLILRFTIAEINEEGVTAKDGLLLWCQRHTRSYEDVHIEDFGKSWKDGRAFLALIHSQRPDLLNYPLLDRSNPKDNCQKAFEIASTFLNVPALLEVDDVASSRLDDRSIMAYVATLYHAFTAAQATDVNVRRVVAFVENQRGNWEAKNDYERRARKWLQGVAKQMQQWTSTTSTDDLNLLRRRSKEYKSGFGIEKTNLIAERVSLSQLLMVIDLKMETYRLAPYTPPAELATVSLAQAWTDLTQCERRYVSLMDEDLSRIRCGRRENLDRASSTCATFLDSAFAALGQLPISNPDLLLERLSVLNEDLDTSAPLLLDVQARQEALSEVSDPLEPPFALDALAGLNEALRKAYKDLRTVVEAQLVVRRSSTATPAQLEEWTEVFNHFDRDASQSLDISEFSGALAALGILLEEDEIVELFDRLSQGALAIDIETYLSFLSERTKDVDPAQVRAAFFGLTEGQKCLTPEALARLPPNAAEYLTSSIAQTAGPTLDFTAYLDEQLSYP